MEQVLILGAGYDSRAYRFATELDGRPVFEVDLAPLSRRKASVIAANRELFAHASVHRVEIDFRTQSLAGQLAGSPFTTGAPTFVVWEGVSVYLTRSAVLETLGALASVCGPGSVLAVDFWQQVGGRRPYDLARRVGERAIRLIGEPMTFALDASAAGPLLESAGFTVFDLAEAGDMTARYATAGRRCDDGMYVAAARLR
jgi:methyltransferase (TIGR00027 family)